MDKINYRIILDAHKGGVQKVLRGFFTGDVAARTIAVSINASGVSCKFGVGTTAIMYVTKENGVTNYGACEVVDNTVYYNVLQADTDCAGIVEMQLKVVNEGTVLYAPMFALEVQESKASDTIAETTPQFSALEAMVAKAQMVYDTRLLSIELKDDFTFVANYADGSKYESDALVRFRDEMDAATDHIEDLDRQIADAIAEYNTKLSEFTRSVESANNAKNSASASAANAAESAAKAKESEDIAVPSATEAKKSADSAKSSASSASASASSAATSEANAKASEEIAVASAEGAKESEEIAARCAEGASVSERAATEASASAEENATIATQKATEASVSADNANAYKEDAKFYAEAAQSSIEQVNQKLGLAEFSIDENGNLIYTETSAYVFSVDDNGNLNWEVE